MDGREIDMKYAFLLGPLILLLGFSALYGAVRLDLTIYRTVPQCAEDAVIIGTGDFDNGRWTQYICGPALDDYTGGD